MKIEFVVPGPLMGYKQTTWKTMFHPNERARSKVSGEHYYLGGRVYNSWADVPDSYKVSAKGAKDPNKSTLSVFTFSWK